MADNVQLSAGSADGAVFATDDIGGVNYEKIIVGWNIAETWDQPDLGAGAVDTRTQRVTLASDDPAVTDLAAIEVLLGTIDTDTSDMASSLGSLDNAVDGNYLNVNVNMAGTDAQAGEGAITASTQRVTIATDDDGVAHLNTIAGDTTSLDGKVTACDTTAVQIASGTITAVTAISNELPAGTQNIGDVDVVTVPAPLSTTGGGTEAAALRVTVATDSTGVLSVDDNGSSLTVDTTGTAGLEVVQDTAADLNVTEASAADILTKVDVMDDWDDGSDHCEIVDANTATLGTTTYSEGTTKGPVVGAVRNDDLATLADTDNEAAPLQVNSEGALYVCDAAAEVKRSSGVAAGSGADTMVAAVASRYIRVLALGLFATSTTTNNVYVDNDDNDLLFNAANPLPLSLDADGDTVPGFVLPYNPGGWFQTDAVNEAVTLTSDAAQDIAWTITYIEVA